MRLTAAQCRILSKKLHSAQDEEVLEVRDALYLLADLALDVAMDEIEVPNNPVGIHDSAQKTDNENV